MKKYQAIISWLRHTTLDSMFCVPHRQMTTIQCINIRLLSCSYLHKIACVHIYNYTHSTVWQCARIYALMVLRCTFARSLFTAFVLTICSLHLFYAFLCNNNSIPSRCKLQPQSNLNRTQNSI